MDRVPTPPEVEEPPAHTVAAIFARAERVFERRVDQLLQLKRHKARLAGTTFNARKAKRDARTVAGREKLDALVRRLADLATLQELALGEERSKHVATALNSSAVAVVGVAALAAEAEASEAAERPQDENTSPELGLDECGDESCSTDPAQNENALPVALEDPEGGKDVLETSSCSDDCCSVGGCLSNYKDLKEALEPEVTACVQGGETASAAGGKPHDRHIFPATESVVNFVLECDDDAGTCAMYNYDYLQKGYAPDMYPICQPVTRYDPLVTSPPHRTDWPTRRYPMQSASSL